MVEKKALEAICGSANQHRVRICKIIKMKNAHINKNTQRARMKQTQIVKQKQAMAASDHSTL